ncbi:MAG TPA: hypothetical protein VFQ51_08765 [Vicinamibacteria bacterium]|nr:hypothetical protein [Vicinamibacteria bacterium]
MTQHSSMTVERWRGFPVAQQLMMIANEMNRASKLQGPEDGERLRGSYERVLALTDLTIQATERRALRRELLRWRDVVGGIYVGPGPDPRAHAQAFRVLLQFHPETWAQLPHVTGAALPPGAGD